MATNSGANAAQSVLVFPPRGLEIQGNVSMAAFCDAGKNQFQVFSNWCSVMQHALASDLAMMLREEGLDGQRQIGPISLGSDAKRTGIKAVKSLGSISAEAANIAKAFMVLDRMTKAYVFEPIREAQAARERQKRGQGLKMGA